MFKIKNSNNDCEEDSSNKSSKILTKETMLSLMDKGKLTNKQKKKLEKKAKFKEKVDMYDMIVANLIAGKSIIEPSTHLGNTQLAIGFSNIASETQITKYFLIRQFPDWLRPQLIDLIRTSCITDGVKINFNFYSTPYKIDWNSAEMRNKMSIWKRYTNEYDQVSTFDYRDQRGALLAKERITLSTKYLNEAELDYKRSLMKVSFMIEVSAKRDEYSILNMMETIERLKTVCNASDIKLKELNINMMDWVQNLGIFSMKKIKEVDNKISRKIMTDDLLANFNSYKQGRVGLEGICMGIDILSSVPVLRKFKQDPDAAENWIISAETGGGKSYFVKSLITYLLADGFVVTVMDYEGDEYNNLASYIRAGNRKDVKVISMGKGSTIYFDPCEIPDLTGDDEVDNDLKESATSYITQIFRLIACGLKGDLSQWEERIISMAIQRAYDCSGVTDDKSTWHRSKGMRLSMIYEEIKRMVECKELIDNDSENIKHKAALKIANAASIYFEDGESKSGTFKNPMSANELYKAKFIVFSFGMRGASNSLNDPIILALKQLSVAYVSIQISNYCKYVKHCFNVKVWEEYQRWGDAEGSADIIGNAMTGGRKRGDVNFIITNDLASMLDDNNKLNERLRNNTQNYAIGKISDRKVREKFCEKFDLQDCEFALDKISKAYTTDDKSYKGNSTGNRYRHSFCLVLDNGKKAIVKSILPPSLGKSKLFKTGVDISENKG